MYVYACILIYCPIRCYSEVLLAMDSRPMTFGLLVAKQKATDVSEKGASPWGLSSIAVPFVTGLQPHLFSVAKSSYFCSDIHYSLLFFEMTSFLTRLPLSGYSLPETVETNSERRLSGDFRAATFVTCPQRNATWRGKWHPLWDVKMSYLKMR